MTKSQQPINRKTVKTHLGFRTYGAFTSVLDTDNDGNVIYSNMTSESLEFKRMLINNTNFRNKQ